MGTRTTLRAWALVSSLLAASRALSDEGEWRVAAGGGAVVTKASVGGADGTAFGFEAHGRVARGLTNAVDLGLTASYAEGTDVAFAGATLGGQTGTLYSDLRMVSLGLDLRLAPGVALARAFERTGPYLAVRASGALSVRTSQEILSRANLLLTAPPDALGLGLVVGGALGLERRFGDHFVVALELGASVGADARRLALTSEVAWAWY